MATRPMGTDPSAQPAKQPVPFWHRLNTFFAFPLQSKPLLHSLMLAFSSMLYKVFFFLPDALALLIVEVGILWAASRYGFKVTALGSRGIDQADDYPVELDPNWKNLPWILFAILIAQSIAVGWLQQISLSLGTLAWLAMCFLLPATQMVLVQTGSFTETLNPANAWNAVRTMGWPYLLPCVVLFLLSQGTFIVLGMLLPIVHGWIFLPLVNWVLIYFAWVMASLLGYAMYQNHEAFGIALLPGAGLGEDAPPVDRRSPRRIEQDAIDAQVAELVTAGDMVAALAVAYEEQRTRGEEVAAQRRYHRVLALTESKTATLLDHAQRYIPLMLKAGHGGEALKAFQTCRAKDAAFELRDANATLHLAQAAWKAHEAQEALDFLQGFDHRFQDHDSVPAAYELLACVLLQGMNRVDMALRVLVTLESRYPDTDATRETQWLLRNHVPQRAAGIYGENGI